MSSLAQLDFRSLEEYTSGPRAPSELARFERPVILCILGVISLDLACTGPGAQLWLEAPPRFAFDQGHTAAHSCAPCFHPRPHRLDGTRVLT